MSKPGGSQCVLNTCVSAPPQYDCRYIDDLHCETLVNGGFAAQELLRHIPTARDAAPPQFLACFLVTRGHPILEKAGIAEGDLITHVHMSKYEKGEFPRTMKQFAGMIARLRRGDRLYVIRADGNREWVSL